MKMKKFVAMLLVAGLTFSSYSATSIPAVQAQEAVSFAPATVATIDNLDEYDTKAPLSWSCDLVSPEDGQPVSAYASFTLEKDSIVKMSVKYTDTADLAYTSPDVFVYSNSAMTSKKMEFGQYDDGETRTAYLPAGTYYIQAIDEKLMGWDHGVKVDTSICAMPVEKALSASTKVNSTKTKATITVNQAFGADLKNIQYVYGSYDAKDNENSDIWKTPILGDIYYDGYIATELTNGNTFTVKKNGTYTIRVITNDETTYSIKYKVKGIDTTAPTVTGVKNKKTYKKAVTIKFSDKGGSGIKKATLNGKKISSGKKVSKKGSYTLKVTDKAGNAKTIKFTIKK